MVKKIKEAIAALPRLKESIIFINPQTLQIYEKKTCERGMA